MEDAAIGMAIEPRGVATTTSASGPPAGASDSAGMRYVPRPTSSLPCLSPSRGRTHASASHCFRDRPAQDRGGADRDVGDHRRRREPAAPEVGQRRQRAPSRFAAVAASARCRGSPPNGQLPTTSEARAGQGLLAPPEDRRLNVGSYARRCCVAMSSRRQHTRWSRRTASLSVLTRMARL